MRLGEWNLGIRWEVEAGNEVRGVEPGNVAMLKFPRWNLHFYSLPHSPVRLSWTPGPWLHCSKCQDGSRSGNWTGNSNVE